MMMKVKIAIIFTMFTVVSCNNNKVNNKISSTIKNEIVVNYRDSTFKTLEATLAMPDSVFALSLKEKGYKSFPVEIFKLRNLEYLDLSMNPIDSIPIDIKKLKSLEVLILTYGELQYISPNLCMLKSLKELNFLYNEIQELPVCLSVLENLEIINFNGNPISKIPLNIHKLKKLKMFCVENEGKSLLSTKEKEYIKKHLKHCKVTF